MDTDYKPCHCGGDCYKYDDDDEQKTQPCWGEVYPIDEINWGEDWSWVHACQGHGPVYDGDPYRKVTDA